MTQRAQIKGKVSWDSTGAEVGLKRAEKQVTKFKSAMVGMAGTMGMAFGVAAIIRLGTQAIATASKISDLAIAVGLTAEQYQVFELAALKAGQGPEAVATALTKLSIALGQAKGGMGTQIRQFEAMGISAEALKDVDMAGAIEAVAKTIHESEDGSYELSEAWGILGTRTGPKLREVFDQIAIETFPAMAAAAVDAARIMAEATVKTLDEMADRIDLIKRDVSLNVGKGIVFGHDAVAGGAAAAAVMVEAYKEAVQGQSRWNPFRHIAGYRAAFSQETRTQAGLAVLDVEGNAPRKDFSATGDTTPIDSYDAQLTDWTGRRKPQRVLEYYNPAVGDAAEAEQWKTEQDLRAKIASAMAGYSAGNRESADRLADIGGYMRGQLSPAAVQAERTTAIAEQIKALLETVPEDIAERLAAELEDF